MEGCGSCGVWHMVWRLSWPWDLSGVIISLWPSSRSTVSLQREATQVVTGTCLGQRFNRSGDRLSSIAGDRFWSRPTEWRWEIDIERQWKNHRRNRGSDREDAGKVGMGSIWLAENPWVTATNCLEVETCAQSLLIFTAENRYTLCGYITGKF